MREEKIPGKISGELAVPVEQFNREKDYWLKKLSGELEKCYFPYDYEKTVQNECKKDSLTFRLNQNLFSKLIRLSNSFDPGLHIILVTGLAVLLNKYTGSNDVIVGAPIYKQQREGQFTNTMLVLRNQLKPGMTFRELLPQVKQTIIEAAENQSYPVKRLVDNLDIHNSSRRNDDFPLVDTALLLQNIHDKKYLRDIHLNMIFSFLRTRDCIESEVEYNAIVYKKTTIERIVGGYKQLLQNALNDVNLALSHIEILTEEERKQLLVDFNNTRTTKKFTGTIDELFERQVEKTPGNTAAGMGITYKELNQRSNQLARVLKKNRVNSESVVGIMLDPSPEMVIGLMAILKAGGAYLPIDPDLAGERVLYMLKDSGARILLSDSHIISHIPFTVLQNFEPRQDIRVIVTRPRPHIKEFDRLPRPDRGLINLENYKNKIGMASVTNCVSIQATRGCPYQCLYCHKIWSKTHIYRNPEDIYNEIEYYYNNRVTNFAFIDDCFNLNEEKSSRLFQLISKNKLKVQLFFPNGLRGDIMTPGYIDRMVDAGTRGINLSLETASPRLQKLLKKNLDLDKFKKVLDYITCQHPHVVLELASMHGFPTETEEEALMTLDFIKSIKWIHFPYIHILKIFPNTEMEEFALAHGVSKKDIMISKDRSFHELPETLPFSKSFTRKYQADFLNNYFLSKERLKQVLPYQMKILSEVALTRKYNAYLPVEINAIDDIIQFTQPGDIEIPVDLRQEKDTGMSIFDRTQETREVNPGAKKILFLDLSQHFSSYNMLYKVVEQPLGMICLLTYLKERFGNKIDGKIYKSGNDFDSFKELRVLVERYRPDLVGIRTLTFFKEFFHETVSMLRQWGINIPIITGGPYASSDYDTILKDKNIDLVVLGEGEYTLGELIEAMLANDFKLPPPGILDKIQGIAYAKQIFPGNLSHEIVLMDLIEETMKRENMENLEPVTDETKMAYVMYTSGSTGKPKGVMVEHRQVNNCISWMQDKFNLDQMDVIVNRTNLTFDPSAWEIFWPLYIGAGIKILGKHQRKDAEFLIKLMAEDTGLTMMYCPATLVNMITYLLKAKTPKPALKLPWLIIGAEPIRMDTVKDFYSYFEGRIVNTYGPTECTINNTYYDLEPGDERTIVPIGKPVANNRLYILSRDLLPMPVKIPGEICIAGDSVARGYLNKPDLTAERFNRAGISHLSLVISRSSKTSDCSSKLFPNDRFYRTGDIGRWLEDGTIEIMGRVDEQVKIRGYRIELVEIEAALRAHPAVNETVVVVKDDKEIRGNILTCKKCGITSNYPGIKINDEGLCDICLNFNRTKKYINNYFGTPKELERIIKEENKQKKGTYDCLLLYSGGRGAAYALYQLVDMGFHVLSVMYDNGYFSKSDLDNIKKITEKLGVDHIVLTHKDSDHILKESLKSVFTMCRGCFHTSSSLAGEYAYKNDINVVVGATLSRGQIIENRLHMFLRQGITGVEKLENEILKIQKLTPRIDKNIFDYIDIDVVKDGRVHDKVRFLDFYRYCDITNEEMIAYLDNKAPYWKTRKSSAIYSTNCPIKQIGDYSHLRQQGYHYYGAATSWEKRLGHLTWESLKEDLQCKVNAKGDENFLKKIGLHREKPVEHNDKYICAYIVPDKTAVEKDLSTPVLREYLLKRLPGYMIPSYFMTLDKFPLSPNGKINRSALPAPGISRARFGVTYAAPKSRLEKKIADVWQEVLGVDMVGMQDNFFDLGGNSLDVIIMGSKLKEILQKDITAVTLFTHPTISSLAACLNREKIEYPVSDKEMDEAVEIMEESMEMLREGQNE